MKKIVHHGILLLISIPVLLLLMIYSVSATNSTKNGNVVDTQTESTVWISSYVFIVNERNGNCFFYNGDDSLVTGNTLSDYDANYSYFEWYLQDEGNNQYSIRFYDNSQYVLSYTMYEGNLCVCVDQIASGTSLTNKQKWTLDYVTNTGIVGASNATRIKNVDNGQYIFGRDDGGVRLVSDPGNYPDALMWFIDTSKQSNQNVLKTFAVNYNRWIDVNAYQDVTVTTVPQNAYKTSFPEDFIITSLDTSILRIVKSGNTLSFQGISTGSTLIDIKHKYSGATYRIPIAVGQIINNGIYQISNIGSGKFIDVEGPSKEVGAKIQEWTLHRKIQQRWQIYYEGNGYYSIKSRYSGLYMTVNFPSFVMGMNIIQEETLTDAALWKIVPTTQGNYAIIPKCSENANYCLASQFSSVDGQDLWQYSYSDDFNYYDEWYIERNAANYFYSTDIGILPNSNYHIMNVESGRYLNLGHPTNSSMQFWVYTSEDSNNYRSKWKLNLYSISSNVNNYRFSNDYYENQYLDISGSLFTIVADSTKTFEIRRVNYKPYEGTYLIMCNGNYLYEDTETNSVQLTSSISPACFWSFRIAMDDPEFYLFYFSDFTDGTYDAIEGYSFTPYDFIAKADDSALTAYNALDEASVFVFRGHGDAGHLSFGESSLYSYGSNSNNRYSLSTFGENTLARLSVALYVGCSTGVKPQAGLSLQEVTFEKGAHFALGTFDTSITYHADAFVQQLVQHLLSGESLKQSIKAAQTYFDYNDIDIPLYHYNRSTPNYPIIYTGDIYQKIK